MTYSMCRQRHYASNIFYYHNQVLGSKMFNFDEFSVSDQDNFIKDLTQILYQENLAEFDELVISNTSIIPYSKDTEINYMLIEQSELCRTYHQINESSFLIANLELNKKDLLSQVYGVTISVASLPLIFLINKDFQGETKHILQLDIPIRADQLIFALVQQYIVTQPYKNNLYAHSKILSFILATGILLGIVYLTTKK